MRPEVDGSLGFDVEGGRHPVVEQALTREGQPFIANDCDLRRLPRRGGPANLADHRPEHGRQIDLPPPDRADRLMAQIGVFVPADARQIGLVDRIFSRVGAADDLARGRSTFMVEMIETAIILNHASERSLVILDEIGRGTATFDGLSIAWAAIEHLHDSNRLPRAVRHALPRADRALGETAADVNATVRVKEWKGDSSSCTRCRRARRTAPTASRSRSSRACRRR